MNFSYIILLFFVISGCATLQQKRIDYVSSHPELNSEHKRAILNGDVLSGMTMEMVRTPWGSPENIIREVKNKKNIIHWHYLITSGVNDNRYEVTFVKGFVNKVRFLGRKNLPEKMKRRRPVYH
ncbi:MAG: hypothetical protein ABIH89_02925 [Elusimicrobiota bacterium]